MATDLDIQNTLLNLDVLSQRNAFSVSGILFYVSHLRAQVCCVCQVDTVTHLLGMSQVAIKTSTCRGLTSTRFLTHRSAAKDNKAPIQSLS